MNYLEKEDEELKTLTMEQALELYEKEGIIIVCNDGKVIGMGC